MIIKIIPETDAEKVNFKEEEHSGVKELFMFGNEIDEDGDLMDWHIWKGGYRFLLGNIAYYKEILTDERVEKKIMEIASENPRPPKTSSPPKMTKISEEQLKAKRDRIHGINKPKTSQPSLKVIEDDMEEIENLDQNIKKIKLENKTEDSKIKPIQTKEPIEIPEAIPVVKEDKISVETIQRD